MSIFYCIFTTCRISFNPLPNLIMAKINVQESEITIISVDENDYISLTDMANAKESESRAADIIKNWLRNRYTLEFLGVWEQINNPYFKVVEFDHFKSQAGLPSFVLSVSEWIDKIKSDSDSSNQYITKCRKSKIIEVKQPKEVVTRNKIMII